MARREDLKNQRLVEKEASPEPRDPNRPLIFLPPEVITRYKSAVTDEACCTIDRVSAWQSLNQSKQLTPDLTQRIIGILRSSPDPSTRERICQAFSNDTSEMIKNALIERLHADPSDRVREQAVLALLSISQDAVAHDALGWASRFDPSLTVQVMANQGILK
jgi:hypothetical protein